MAIESISLQRQFIYNGVNLPDIAGASLKEVTKVYSGTYPELLNSSPEFVKIEGDVEIYEYKKASVGVKG